MLKTEIIHPALLRGLAEAGHGARILLGDANYPITTKANPLARRVFLNFVPGQIGGADIVKALASTIPIESAGFMTPDDGSKPEIVQEYHRIIGEAVPFQGYGRFQFYDEAAGPDTALVIASGEQRFYANLLITVGVRK